MVTENHYRWDFIGLSTDEKPTPATSDKVVDGSTFYCSDNSKLYVFCKTQWYEKTATGGGGTTYTAGTGIDITEDTISADVDAIQAALDTFTGTDGTSAGTAGVVPAPAATDADKFLKSDGTWATAGGSSVTVADEPGVSTTDAISQKAATGMIYRVNVGDYSDHAIKIGGSAENTANNSVAVGYKASVTSNYGVAIGDTARARGEGTVSIGRQSGGTATGLSYCVSIGYHAQQSSMLLGAIALGAYSNPTATGEMNIGSSQTSYGYNSSNYRLITGVYDGQSAHDAATKGQLDNAIINGGTTAPTTSTVGSVGTLYSCVESGTPHLYSCTAVSGSTYTWSQLV